METKTPQAKYLTVAVLSESYLYNFFGSKLNDLGIRVAGCDSSEVLLKLLKGKELKPSVIIVDMTLVISGSLSLSQIKEVIREWQGPLLLVQCSEEAREKVEVVKQPLLTAWAELPLKDIRQKIISITTATTAVA